MLLGHIAAALAAKKAAPKLSLGTLLIAATFSDILFTLLFLAGIENLRVVPGITVVNAYDLYDYPFSHGLAFNILWTLLFGVIYFVFRKDRKTALVLAAVVFSHWVLDFISHRPDLPVFLNSSPLLGLGLWNSFWGTVIIETGIFIVGVIVYLKSTAAIDKRGYAILAIMVVYSLFMYTGWLFAPPPADMKQTFAGSVVMQIIGLALAFWTDAHRKPS
jgi:hypothetical protein